MILGPVLWFAGLFGLVIGSFGNVVAYRVPAGIALTRPSQCPTCDAPVRWWQNVPVVSWVALRGRCASCKASISSRYPIGEAVTAALFVAVAGYLAVTSTLPIPSRIALAVALWWLAAVSVILTSIDLTTRRLPNSIVLPGYLVALAAFVVACALGAPWTSLVRALIGMVALFGLYWLLRWFWPHGMGGGDVKLAGLLGLYLGWFGWSALAVGALAGFVLGGAFGVALLVSGRASRGSVISYGPWLLAGAWVGILVGEPLAASYLRLVGLS